jgi:hypothetical protein
MIKRHIGSPVRGDLTVELICQTAKAPSGRPVLQIPLSTICRSSLANLFANEPFEPFTSTFEGFCNTHHDVPCTTNQEVGQLTPQNWDKARQQQVRLAAIVAFKSQAFTVIVGLQVAISQTFRIDFILFAFLRRKANGNPPLRLHARADFTGGGPLRRGELRRQPELLHLQASVDCRK